MDGFPEIFLAMDPWLIWAFRLPQQAEVGFALGLCWLAVLAVLVGEVSSQVIVRLNYAHFKGLGREMVKNHNLSLKALAARDKVSYKASNELANEAFGRHFFAQLALNASSLWPLPFLLGWLDFRFAGQTFLFPLAGEVGSAFLFIPLYISVRVLFAGCKRRLGQAPFLARWRPAARDGASGVKKVEPPDERMLRIADLVAKDSGASPSPTMPLPQPAPSDKTPR